jgi:tape measure domain-containing protein
VAEFNLQIGIDAAGARRGASEVRSALNSIRGAGPGAGRAVEQTERRVRRLGDTASSVSGILRGLFAGLAAQQFVSLSDSFTRLNNQIRLVTESTTEFNVIQTELFAIAGRTTAPIEEVATLYGRAALSADALGASQGELLTFTEAVGNALRIAGSSTAEAQGALLQLGQALGGGIVRAEEFNSVLEGARPVLTAVADGLGLTVAELRNLVVEGEVTSQEFFQALISQSEELADTASRIGPTIGSAFTDLNNALTETVGRFSETTGASAGFAQIISDLADFIRGPALVGLVSLSNELGQIRADFANLFQTIGDAGRQLASFINLGGTFGSFGDQIAENLLSPFTTVRTFVQILVIEVSNAFTVIGTQLGGIAAAIERVLSFDLEGAALIEQQVTADVAALRAGRQAAIADALREGEDARNRNRAAFEAVAFGGSTVSAAQREAVLASAPGGGAAGSGTVAQDTTAAKEAERELQRLLRRGESVRQSVRTEQEIYNETLQELATLLTAGAIDQEIFNRAAGVALEELRGTTEQFQFLRDVGRAAAEDIQGAFTDLFLSAGNGLDDFADQFGQTLQRIAANFLANQAIQFLTQGLTSVGGGGGALGALAQGFAGAFADGGRIPAGQFGLVGERGPELVSGPATVTSAGATAAAMAPSINIVNVTDPRAALDALDTNAGSKGIVNQVSANREAIRRELGLA